MARQLKLMAEASKEIEQSKIEVQLKLFSERMQYAREKDLRLYESSLLANENARLSIEKQAEVVKCLTELLSILSRGMQLPRENARGGVPQVAPLTTEQQDTGAPEDPTELE